MAQAKGPIFAAGGFQAFSSQGYTLLFLPDIANDELQQAGQAPVYYWLPDKVRLARKDGDSGDYVFSFIHFEGVQSSATNVGVSGTDNEISGGVLAFSTTTAPPTDALKDVQNQLLDAFKGKDDKYWGWRSPVAPEFRPVPIMDNRTVVSNVSPTDDGSVPAVVPPGSDGAGGTTTPAGASPSGGGAATGGAPPAGSNGASPPPHKAYDPSLPPTIRAVRALPSPDHARSVPTHYRGSNLDPFYLRVEGQGPGSVSPFAENAYSAICGGLESGILWQSFHQSSSVITIHQYMRIKVVSPEVTLRIHGDWDRIQAHLSAAGHYGGLWWGADVQAQFNYLREQGDIKVEMFVDSTLPNADKLQDALDKRSDLVFQKFMDLAQKVIFDPAPFNEKPAEAPSGFLGFGGGVALKLRVDMSHLSLSYEETRQFAYFQDYPISGDLSGIYDEIKANPDAEKKYFTTFYLSDWDRKVSRLFKPVCNWMDRARQWVGEPVAFLSCQVGYPNTRGEIQWDSHVFGPSDPPDAQWSSVTEQKKAEDVANPPQGWTPDKTFVKRQVHFTEPPSADDFPFARVSVEKNIVDIDPGDYGILTTENNLDVRVDSVGMLSVGPIDLDVDLDNAKQEVEVAMQAEGKTDDGQDREVIRFRWTFADQDQSRHWMIFTGQPSFVPKYKYQVTVTVKGTLFSKGMQWTGPWVEAGGNGPLIVTVPMQTDPGVQTRNIPVTSYAPQPSAASSGRLPPPRPGAPQPTTPATAGGQAGKPTQPSSSGRVPPPSGAPSSSGRVPPPSRDAGMLGWSTAPAPSGSRNGPGEVKFSGYSTTPSS